MAIIKSIYSGNRFCGVDTQKPAFQNVDELAEYYKLDDAAKKAFKSQHFAFNAGDEDRYFYREGRALSQVIVAKETYRATDFRRKGVLKASTQMLNNRPLQLDHSVSVKNNRGRVLMPKYKKAFESNGITVPAGINGILRINKVLYPELVEQLSGDLPDLQSLSVGIMFEAERSHPNLLDKYGDEISDWVYSYYWVGKYVDGKMVTWEVTNILFYDELSIVYDGADDTSQILDIDGVPYDMEMVTSDIFTQAREEGTLGEFTEMYNKNNKYIASHSNTFQVIKPKEPSMDLTLKSGAGEFIIVTGGEVNKEVFKKLEAHLKETEEKASLADDYKAKLDASNEQAKANESIKSEFEKLKEEHQTLKVENERLISEANKEIESKRDAVKKAYHATLKEEDTPNEAYLSLISKANNEELNAFAQTFNVKFGSELPQAVCNNCGSSDHITYSSHDKGGDGDETSLNQSKSHQTALDDLERKIALG